MENFKDQVISIEAAILAKELGFNWLSEGGYLTQDEGSFMTKCTENWHDYNIRGNYSAPTQTALQKWLREIYKAETWVAPWLSDPVEEYSPVILYKGNNYHPDIEAKTYEEAFEKGLIYTLKLILFEYGEGSPHTVS